MVSPIQGGGSSGLPKGRLARQAVSQPLLSNITFREIGSLPIKKGAFAPLEESELELTAEESQAFAQNILDIL